MCLVHLIISFLFFLVASKYGDWRNWRKYYATIQFLIMGDLIYNVVFINTKPLWMHKSPSLGHTLINFVSWMPINYTCIVLVYLPHFPKTTVKIILYVLAWLISMILLEVILHYLKAIDYYNDWNIMWSSVNWAYLLILLKIHYHKPILAWIITITILIIMVNLFKVPLGALP
jgi:hypothetical protein